jgi:hypothetical protein
MKYKNIFTEDEYNSGDGMNVNIWGKMAWTFLHCISFNYPTNPTEMQKDQYHNFLMSLKHVLPCQACRNNYANNLKTIGYNRECLENRKSFSMFMYRLHNCVNKMLNKDCPLTYSEVRDRYEMFRARCIHGVPSIPKHKTRTGPDFDDDDEEEGCDSPLYGIRSKTIIKVIPITERADPINIDTRCKIKRKNKAK